MDSRAVFSRGGGGSGVSPGSGGQEPVSLEAFIISNWQILTILGVFAGFTNYLSSTENQWLVAFGFLLTLLVELEILQLLLKVKNKSLLLNIFTLLSAVLILIFAGVIYSKTIANESSGILGGAYSLMVQNRGLLTGIMFLLSAMLVFLGIYQHLRSAIARAPRLRFRVDTKILAGLFIVLILLVVVLASVWVNRAPEETGPVGTLPPPTSTEGCPPPLARVGGACCPDSDSNEICDADDVTPTSSFTTTSTLAAIVCSTNSDCGNQTQTRICYLNDVYIQQATPLCQKPDTGEARCTVKVGFLGNPMTQEPVPYEKCQRGCINGTCVTRP